VRLPTAAAFIASRTRSSGQVLEKFVSQVDPVFIPFSERHVVPDFGSLSKVPLHENGLTSAKSGEFPPGDRCG
jgi:hypothetical protein